MCILVDGGCSDVDDGNADNGDDDDGNPILIDIRQNDV